MARTVEVTPARFLPRGEAVVIEPGLRPLVVWGGIPGEKSRVRLEGQGAHQVYGEWLSSVSPSAHRVTPPCEKFTPCGGCPIMHLDAAGQARARRSLIRMALDEAGLERVTIADEVACPDGADGYRHLVKVGFGVSDIGRLKVGAWGRNSRQIVPIPACNAAAPILRKTMVSLAHHTITLGIEPYDRGRERGVLRSAVMRASRTTGEVLITLVAARRDRLVQELAEEVCRGVSEVTGVWLHLNDGEGNAIFQRDDQGVVGVLPLVGREWIEEKLDGVAYRIGPGDFFQTNPSVAELLYRAVIDELEVVEGDAVVDLYCGVGGISLMAARRSGFALGVEEIEGAVTRAREAARINRVSAEFVSGPVIEVLPELAPRLAGTGPKVVVDPARRGLEPGVLDRILALDPSRIAYVSCNPGAMARDLGELAKAGWRIGRVIPFDMFPNTAHVECLVVADPPEGAATQQRRAPRRQLVR
ncbi:MAG: 23S rRNA (uracil(1939)-C(5))-methyltransferase RlmD [Myxococcota bacterium]